MIGSAHHEKGASASAKPSYPRPVYGSRLPTFSLLSREEREALDDAMTMTGTVKPNTDLVREGERADSLHFIIDGWACRYSVTRQGGRQISALLVNGDACNLESLLFERANNGVRTLTEASVVALPRGRAAALASKHAGIARAFTQLALIDQAILSQRLLSIGRRTAIERVAHLLLEISSRLGNSQGARRSYVLPLTQEQVGDVLGLTSVHVNRMMKELRDEGLLEVKARTVTLLNMPELERMCGFDANLFRVANGTTAPGF